jgi:hypothetical protein
MKEFVPKGVITSDAEVCALLTYVAANLDKPFAARIIAVVSNFRNEAHNIIELQNNLIQACESELALIQKPELKKFSRSLNNMS